MMINPKPISKIGHHLITKDTKDISTKPKLKGINSNEKKIITNDGISIDILALSLEAKAYGTIEIPIRAIYIGHTFLMFQCGKIVLFSKAITPIKHPAKPIKIYSFLSDLKYPQFKQNSPDRKTRTGQKAPIFGKDPNEKAKKATPKIKAAAPNISIVGMLLNLFFSIVYPLINKQFGLLSI
ncbi:hypothetical protein [Spirochaeta cellobiosiphila]|uniref:hypothetical protein n=1 Tax=Spirochaeta cellobiosiphila TaxID=504483 RepID=UPI00048D91AC|nr:hypothetical protein [Spirochaeta cellobiosiphila]